MGCLQYIGDIGVNDQLPTTSKGGSVYLYYTVYILPGAPNVMQFVSVCSELVFELFAYISFGFTLLLGREVCAF